MTRGEAEAHCSALNREALDGGHRWLPQETSDGEWRPVRVRVPELGPLESGPRPSSRASSLVGSGFFGGFLGGLSGAGDGGGGCDGGGGASSGALRLLRARS
jgi:hypothetical protein